MIKFLACSQGPCTCLENEGPFIIHIKNRQLVTFGRRIFFFIFLMGVSLIKVLFYILAWHHLICLGFQIYLMILSSRSERAPPPPPLWWKYGWESEAGNQCYELTKLQNTFNVIKTLITDIQDLNCNDRLSLKLYRWSRSHESFKISLCINVLLLFTLNRSWWNADWMTEGTILCSHMYSMFRIMCLSKI